MSDFIDSLGFRTDDLLFESKAATQEIFIELGDSKKKANVVRDRVVIPAVEVNKEALDEFVFQRPKIVNKVVSQSIAPGTVVSEGAAIDLVMAPAKSVPGRIFTDGHLGLKDLLLAEVYEKFVAPNDGVKKLLAKRPDAFDLTDEELTFIAAVAEEQDVEIAGTPGSTPQDLFATWQIANTFAS